MSWDGKYITVSYQKHMHEAVCDLCGTHAGVSNQTFPDESKHHWWAEAQRQTAGASHRSPPAGWTQYARTPTGVYQSSDRFACPSCTKSIYEVFASKRVIREAAPTQAPAAPKPKGNWDMDKYMNGDD